MQRAVPSDDDGDGRDEIRQYITRQGAETLRAEVRHLLSVERPKVTAEVSHAASLGDRSENADYIYGKRRLREIDRRLHLLTHRLASLQIVDVPSSGVPERVVFGSVVAVLRDGTANSYALVGQDEASPKAGSISIASPLGRALLGKRVGDEVKVSRPNGDVVLTVTRINYAKLPPLPDGPERSSSETH